MKAENVNGRDGVKNLLRTITEKENVEKDYPSRSILLSKRFLVSIVIFLCFVNSAMLMGNMSIAVVEMTSNKTITVGNTTLYQPAEFDWDTITIGTVSSILSYGGLFAFCASFFIDLFGGSTSCAMSMALAGILTILHPAVLYLNYNAFLVCRFLAGFFLHSFFVSTSEMYSRWFPKTERSFLISVGYNGYCFGIAITYPLFGYIANQWGWQMVFYVSGTISLLFATFCLILVRNRPSQDGWISKDELVYILEGTDDALRKKQSHPYKRILTSAPVFAVCIGRFTIIWLDTLLTMSLPLYVKDLTGKSTDVVGIVSAIPTGIQIFTFPIAGALLDAWKNNTNIGLTLIHKITVASTYLTSAILFLIVILANDFIVAMIIFVLIQLTVSFVPLVYEPIIVNISPDDTSVIAGLTRIFTCLGTIVPRACIGVLTTTHSSQGWDNCFLLMAVVLVVGTVIFTKFASSEAQPWSSLGTSQQERQPLTRIKYRRKSSIDN